MANASDFINLTNQSIMQQKETVTNLKAMTTVLQRIAEEHIRRNNEDDFNGTDSRSADWRSVEFLP
jgi:hypothetical protein